MNRQVASKFSRDIDRLYADMEQMGLQREALAQFARILQEKLSIDSCRGDRRMIKSAEPLELIMRAIIALIEGEPGMRGYIIEKLTCGLNGLAHDLQWKEGFIQSKV